MSPTAPAPPPATTVPASPAAPRLTPRRWRDPRLWVGLLLVAASVVVGGRLLASADDTVRVWAVARDLPAGAPVTAGALAVRRVRFADDATALRYLPAGRAVPPGRLAAHDLTAGELLSGSSLATGRTTPFEVPVVVGPGGAPDDLVAGNLVDVWVGPQAGSGTDAPARRMLTAVPVVAAAHTTGPFGDSETRQVLLGVDRATAVHLGPVLGAMASGSVVLVRHGATR